MRGLSIIPLVLLAACGDSSVSAPAATSGGSITPAVIFFKVAPLKVSGSESYVAGEYLYQDYLYDDFGSAAQAGAGPTFPAEVGNASPYSLLQNVGSVTYPTDTARYANNAADLFEFRIHRQADATGYRIKLNTWLDLRTSMAVIACNTDRNPGTGVATLSRDPGGTFTGTDEAIYLWGTGAEHVKHSATGTVTTPLTIQTQLSDGLMSVIIANTVSNPSGVWDCVVGTGLGDGNGGWLRPGPNASATAPGGAGPQDPQPSALFNMAFRFSEPVQTGNNPPDTLQSDVIKRKAMTELAHAIDFDALLRGENRDLVPKSGTLVRWYTSSADLGPGRTIGLLDNPKQLGKAQQYSLYVPSTYSPDKASGMFLALHSLTQGHWQYNGSQYVQQVGEQLDNLVLTTMGRGPAGWYRDYAELDLFEAWAEVKADYRLDPIRTSIGGYSMGGFGTYRIGGLYPHLFAKAFTQVGPAAEDMYVPGGPAPEAGQFTNLWLENFRNLPMLNQVGMQDEQVPYAGVDAQNRGNALAGVRGLEQLGYEYRFQVFNPATHYSLLLNDNYPMGTEFLRNATVNPNPPHVTFAYLPASDFPALGFIHNQAYWLSEISLNSAADDTDKAVVDALSHGFGVGDAPTTGATIPGSLTGDLGVIGFIEYSRTRGPAPSIPVANRLDLTLSNTKTVTIDLARARLSLSTPLTLNIISNNPGTLTLRDGSRSQSVSYNSGSAQLTVQ